MSRDRQHRPAGRKGRVDAMCACCGLTTKSDLVEVTVRLKADPERVERVALCIRRCLDNPYAAWHWRWDLVDDEQAAA
jgi:hypothetical protein